MQINFIFDSIIAFKGPPQSGDYVELVIRGLIRLYDSFCAFNRTRPGEKVKIFLSKFTHACPFMY